MKQIIQFILLLVITMTGVTVAKAQGTAKDVLPSLKGDYVFETLRVDKMSMNGNVIAENRMETTYNDNDNVTSIIQYSNGQKVLEMVNYNYGDKTCTYEANNYLNGQKTMSQKISNTYADNIYRNIAVSEIVTDGVGSRQRNEFTYDEQGRMTSMKQFANGQLQLEQNNYVWTPNSVEYETISYFPMSYTAKVSKKFKDEYYVQNVLEVTVTDVNGLKSENKVECTYDDDGNITSMKSYQNGQLTMEWTEYSRADKKCTHKEITYINGNPMSVSEVTQIYK